MQRAKDTCYNRRSYSKGRHGEDGSSGNTHQCSNAISPKGGGLNAKAAPWFFTPLTLVFLFTLIILSTSVIMVLHLQKLDNENQVMDNLLLAKEIYRKNVETNPDHPPSQQLQLSQSDERSSKTKGKEHESDDFKLDFIMGGFPKTGSTSFLHLFQHHNETNVLEREMCAFSSDEDISTLSHLLDELPIKSKTMQRGIKCPVTLWNTNGLSKLSRTKKDLKLIIGVRNPVSWFQSFYNYRVTEMHDKNMVVTPPAPNKLISPDSWKGVTTDGSRFDMALMQLGKVELGPNDLMLLGEHRRRVIPQPSLKIFLYTIDQLKDEDEERSRIFHRDLQRFLGLEEEIEHIPVSNKNHFTRENKYPETINICSKKYNKLRSELVMNLKLSYRWIRSKFVDAEHV